VFDHTSLIQFIEQRFGGQYPDLIESNITRWRRAVVGDLTSAFNFKTPNEPRTFGGGVDTLPSTAGYLPPDAERHPDYTPAPPTVQTLPKQEPGIRPARAVPYELHVSAEVDPSGGALRISFGNSGREAAVFQVRSAIGQDGPWTYTVGPGARVSETFKAAGQGGYNLSVYGPNGFFRSFEGDAVGGGKANLIVKSTYQPDHFGLTLDIHNRGAGLSSVRILDAYSKDVTVHSLQPGETWKPGWPLEASYGWYDFTIEVESDPTFRQRVAGHIETGSDSMSDPAIGAS
jgi:phospholipase C